MSNDKYDGPERRSGSDRRAVTLTHEQFIAIISIGKELGDKVDVLHGTVTEHILREEPEFRKIIKAFPNDDPVAHRIYHEGVAEAKKEEAEFWKKLRNDIVSRGIMWFLIFILGLIALGGWSLFLSKIKGG